MGLHFIQYRGVGGHHELIWVTLNNFTFLWWHHSHSTLVRFFLGTLWSSIKQIKSPFVLYWEHGIAEHAMQGNCASSLDEGEVAWIFSSRGRNLGYILQLCRVGISIFVFLQQRQHSCLVMKDTSRIKARRLSTIRTLLEVRSDTEDHFLFDTVILGYLTIFKICQPSSTFEAVISTWSSNCQRYVRPHFEWRWTHRAFCRVSTGDSDILSSCDMKNEHALRLCREIWPSLKSWHLGVHFAWSIKHRVLLTYIFLRENSSWYACGKLGYLFSQSQGISSHLQTIWGAQIFHPVSLLKLMFL